MKLYNLFKGMEYVGKYTLDEIIVITGAHRSKILNSIAYGYTVDDLWSVSTAEDRTLNRKMDYSLLNQFEAVTGQIRRCMKRE